jgi:hypothetical protein
LRIQFKIKKQKRINDRSKEKPRIKILNIKHGNGGR